MMKKIALAIAVLLLSSCGICKHCPGHTETNVKDSLSVHHKDSTSITDETSIRDSLVAIPLPTESSSAVLPQILPSHLETSLAESDAYVDSLGLHHTLKNKEGALEAHVPVTDHYHNETHYQQTDSSASHSESEKETVTEYVDKPLTWWQNFRIKAFWWLVLLCIVGFRKELFALIKKII